jgi:hypothetical protein
MYNPDSVNYNAAKHTEFKCTQGQSPSKPPPQYPTRAEAHATETEDLNEAPMDNNKGYFNDAQELPQSEATQPTQIPVKDDQPIKDSEKFAANPNFRAHVKAVFKTDSEHICKLAAGVYDPPIPDTPPTKIWGVRRPSNKDLLSPPEPYKRLPYHYPWGKIYEPPLPDNNVNERKLIEYLANTDPEKVTYSQWMQICRKDDITVLGACSFKEPNLLNEAFTNNSCILPLQQCKVQTGQKQATQGLFTTHCPSHLPVKKDLRLCRR